MTLISALLTLALVVIVPLALRLHRDGTLTPAVVGAGLTAAFSLDYEQGALATALAAPWLLVSAWLAVRSGWRWLRSERALADIARPAALGYLAVGAAWLLFDRAGIEPVGVVPPFVVLTAVHFSYAGFTATVLAGLVRRHTAGAAPGLSSAMVIAVVGAPPIVALGFTVAGALQIVGAVVLTAGLFMLAWLTIRHVARDVDDTLARALLIVSSVAVVVPMLLAVQWAVGWNFGTPALSIEPTRRAQSAALSSAERTML